MLHRFLLLACLNLPLLASAQQERPEPSALALARLTLPPVATDSLVLEAAPDTTGSAPVVEAEPNAAPVAADSVLPALRNLTAVQRQELGRRDAKKHYRPARGIFWGSLGSAIVGPMVGAPIAGPTGFALGAGGAIALGAGKPKEEKLRTTAPQPELLTDRDYHEGYLRQARQKKFGKAALGWGVGTVVTLGTAVGLAIIFLSGGFS